jgi:hypothetical protein
MQSKIASSSRVYRTLSGDSEIRIVILLPSTSFETTIECRLEHAVIGSCKPYEALSYVWGEPHFTESITLNDQTFMITPRLATALRYLRLPAEERALWIDAICINQQDLAERQKQVGYMRNIYSTCSTDILWLGPEDDEYSQGMEVVRRLGTLTRKQDKIGKKRLTIDHSEKLAEKNIQAVYRVLHKDSVWKRVWIMQEISCSPNVILTSGHATLDWSVVEMVAHGGLYYTDAFHGPYDHGSMNDSYTWSFIFGTAKRVMNQRGAMTNISEGKFSTLLDVLARFKHTEASDPRDKIYALLGLVNDPLGVRVDYMKSAAEIYVGVALALINSSANLDILCQCPWESRHRRRNLPPLEGLPSWAPDFRINEDGPFLFAQRGIYSTGRPTCSVPCVVQGATLLLKGHCLGRLQASKGLALSREEPSLYRMPSLLLRDWAYKNLITDEYGKIAQQKYHTGEDQLQAFWRTLVGDCKGYPQKRLTSDEIVRDQMAVRRLVDEPVQPARAEHPLDITSRQIFHKLIFVESWRFHTSDSGLFVLAQHTALEGDVIAILDGAKTPMVFRPTGTCSEGNQLYSSICGAYIHGFMDGEVLEAGSKCVEKIFRLV